MTKPTKWHVRPAKTQIRLGGSESSLCAQWVAKDSNFLPADSEDPDQTGRMPRLIWVFTGRTATLLVLSQCGSFYNTGTGTYECMWERCLTNFHLLNIRGSLMRPTEDGIPVHTCILLGHHSDDADGTLVTMPCLHFVGQDMLSLKSKEHFLKNDFLSKCEISNKSYYSIVLIWFYSLQTLVQTYLANFPIDSNLRVLKVVLRASCLS